MNKSKKITHGAILMAIYIILLLMTIFVPLFVLIGVFIIPIPFVIYAAKYSWKPSLLLVVLAIIFSLMFATFISLPFTIIASLGGIAIGTSINKKLSSHETWARGTIGFVIGLLFLLVFSQYVLDINWETAIKSAIEESIITTEMIMDKSGMKQNENQLSLIKEQMESLLLLIPATITIMSIFLSFITTWLSYRIINRMDQTKYAFVPFREFNFPISIFWIYFVLIIFSFFNTTPPNSLSIVVLNGIIIVISLMIIQGFSFIFFYAHEKKWNRSIPIIIVVISFLLPGIMMFIIRIIGIVDLGFSMKNRIISKNEN